MSFTAIQKPDQVVGVYNPVYVLTQLTGTDYDNAFNFRYLFRITAYSISGVATVAPLIRKFPNNAGCGAVDISKVLQSYIEVAKPILNAGTVVASNIGNSAHRFKLEVGYEKSTTADGTITQTFVSASDRDFYGIRGAFSDRYTTTSRNGVQDYVYKNDGTQDGKFLSAGLRREGRLELTASVTDSGHVSYNAMSGASPVTNQYTTLRYFMTYADGTTSTPDTQSITNAITAPVNITALTGVVNLYCMPVDVGGWSFVGTSEDPTVVVDWQYYTVSLGTSATRYSEQLRVYRKTDCQTGRGTRFMFLNSIGGWDFLRTEGYTKQSNAYTRDTVNRVRENYFTANTASDITASPNLHGTTKPVSQIQDKYVANTGAITDAEGQLVQELLRSPQVYAYKFEPHTDQLDVEYYPVNITNSQVSMVYQKQEKIVQYAIEFEYANPITPTY